MTGENKRFRKDLEKYELVNLFDDLIRNGITNLSDLIKLNEEDLRDKHIGTIGDRKYFCNIQKPLIEKNICDKKLRKFTLVFMVIILTTIAGITIYDSLRKTISFQLTSKNISENKETVLYQAVRNNDLPLLKKIIDKGADVKINNEDLLQLSLKLGYIDIAEYLLTIETFDICSFDFLKRILLSSPLSSLEFIQSKGASLNIKDENNATLLMYLACSNTAPDKYVKFYKLVESGCNVFDKNNDNLNCLCLALFADNIQFAKIIVGYIFESNKNTKPSDIVKLFRNEQHELWNGFYSYMNFEEIKKQSLKLFSKSPEKQIFTSQVHVSNIKSDIPKTEVSYSLNNPSKEYSKIIFHFYDNYLFAITLTTTLQGSELLPKITQKYGSNYSNVLTAYNEHVYKWENIIYPEFNNSMGIIKYFIYSDNYNNNSTLIFIDKHQNTMQNIIEYIRQCYSDQETKKTNNEKMNKLKL